MKSLFIIQLLLFVAFFNLSPTICFAQTADENELNEFLFLNEAIDLADQKLIQTLEEISFDASLHPAHTDPETGKWVALSRNEWTSGYFAGALWFMYKFTGDEKWKEYAKQWTEDMAPTANKKNDHDTGLRIYGSFGNGFTLTQNRQYVRVILKGAQTLSSRYSADIDAIKSWDPWESLDATYPVIIDSMMNLELLFMAANYSGNSDWETLAIRHAKTVYKHHFREDGSVYHIVDFDNSGNVNRKFTIQGYGPNSVWARGQAWAIYGFTMAYRYTKQPEFLDAANKAAQYFITHLPNDFVPWYDFLEPAIPNTTRDASAASIAASGLMELYSFTDNPLYFNTSVNILNSLMTDYSTQNTAGSSILLRATIHRGDDERGTIYADYYFLEAIKRYKELMGKNFPEIETESPFFLEQNYPNPFNNSTVIFYSIEEAGNVDLSVYNLAGRKVQSLVNQFRPSGTYRTIFDASGLSSGVYLYRLTINGQATTKKMILLQ
ncbi:MAG: glycoside hydrolase family 88 protein [Balneolaceae bacterium]|nr:glycoside hydrolase family 88 protein [Balneolaceae bacterium]